MGKINQLSPHLSNLIAAGEVIERVASVAKELVENSIDANSTVIEVHLQNAGLSEIMVNDNGDGMDAVDAKMSILPHATSKVANEEDLFHIHTLGFRGEALASIVSVSQFQLKTSTDGKKGYLFSAKAGVITSEATVAFRKGTQIIVKNLFFNTPARLQSLQSEYAELSHILDFMNKIALGNPGIQFKVTNNDKVLLQTNGNGNVLEVVHEIYGLDVSKNMLSFSAKDPFFEIAGYITKPSTTRSTKNHINILVNGRSIRNNGITNSIMAAYKNLLPIGRYPVAVIRIKMDFSLVDVNVHPSKLEVRFSEETTLFELLTASISATLQKANLIVDLDEIEAENEYANWTYDEEELPQETIQADETFDYEEWFKEAEAQSKPVVEETPIFNQQSYEFGQEEIRTKESSSGKLPKLEYIGQFHGTYLLAQDDAQLYLIDQHAAMERVMYEKIHKEFQKPSHMGYDMLIPLRLEFTSNEAILIKENMDQISALGIGLEEFGGNSFMLREIPIWIFRGLEKEFVEEIITHIIENKKRERHEFLDNLAKSLACKKSIKANEFVSSLEIDHLLMDLGKCENPYTCPHGRPTIIKFSTYEIEKWFKRVM